VDLFPSIWNQFLRFLQNLRNDTSVAFSIHTFCIQLTLIYSADRTILIWYLKDLANAKDRKTFQDKIEYGHVYKTVWSADSRTVLGFKAMENTIEAYRFDKKDGQFNTYAKSITFRQAHDSKVVISLEMACHVKFIMSADNETEIIIWDVRGAVVVIPSC
jgi:Protein of unknown function (DUF1295)